VPLGRNNARPSCTVPRGRRPCRARPACAAGAAQLSRHAQRAAHGASAWRWRGSATAARRRRTGDNREQRLTGVETATRRDGDGREARGGQGGTAAVWAARLRTAAQLGRCHGGRGGRGDGGAHEAVGRLAARERWAVGMRGTLSR
jgi:hypothetical protein